MKNPCTGVKVKPESHLINVYLHFMMLLSEDWMTEWILMQEESICHTVFNLVNPHGVYFSVDFRENFKWKAEMIRTIPKLELQSL